jgi:hypothetical protein
VTVLNSLLTAFSIFAGLLLNLLLLVLTFSGHEQQPSMLAKMRVTLIKELHDNIAYSILLSIVLVVIAMAEVAKLKMMPDNTPAFTGRWMTGVVVFLTLNFSLTLLMILKRIYIILNREIENPFIRRSA